MSTRKAVEVKLNQAEEKILGLIPAEQREAAKQALLQTKLANINRANETRDVFKTKVTEKGMLSVSGLTYRFPVTLPREGWERILANVEVIRAEISKLPKRNG